MFFFNFFFKLERVQEYENSLNNLINVTNSFHASSSLRSNSNESINSNQFSSYKQNEAINNSNLDYWKKMKDKCEKVSFLDSKQNNNNNKGEMGGWRE